MLNSAAGVRLPSPIAPPIRMIRSGRASGCVANASPTFVSGPVATSVALRGGTELLGEILDGVLRLGLVARGRQVGPVESGLAVHVRCDVTLPHERRVGAGVHGDVAAACELEHAQRVGGCLVERLVARDGRHSDELDLRRGEREEDGDRVVVPGIAVEDDGGRRHAPSIASSSRGSGERRLRAEPRRGEGTGRAGAAKRLVARALLEQRHDEARCEGVTGCRPVDGVDGWRRGASDLDAVFEQRRALGAVGDRDELPARDDLVLEAVDDQQIRDDVDRASPARR